jgi:hypothetical protein
MKDIPKTPKLTDAERHKRFVDTAKKVEASENLDDFDKAFSRLSLRKGGSLPADAPLKPT